MKRILKKIARGLLLGVKWILIQLFVLVVLFECGLGTRSLYGWDKSLVLSIPFYTLLFSFWHVFISRERHRWTIVFPWLILMVVVYLQIACERDWYFKIITVDQFMLGGWLAPVFGASLQFLWLGLRKLLILKRKNNEEYIVS